MLCYYCTFCVQEMEEQTTTEPKTQPSHAKQTQANQSGGGNTVKLYLNSLPTYLDLLYETCSDCVDIDESVY